jgi:hypothetical protein
MGIEGDRGVQDDERPGSLVERAAIWAVRLVLLPIWLIGIAAWVLGVGVGVLAHGMAVVLRGGARRLGRALGRGRSIPDSQARSSGPSAGASSGGPPEAGAG